MKRKIFLSVPMSGRENVNIVNSLKQMKKVLLAMYPNDDLEFYDNFGTGLELGTVDKVRNAKYPALKYLGAAVMKMGDCDYIAIVQYNGLYRYKGCQVEEQVALRYYGYNNIIRLHDPDGSVYLPDVKKEQDEYDKKHAIKEGTIRTPEPEDPEMECNY